MLRKSPLKTAKKVALSLKPRPSKDFIDSAASANIFVVGVDEVGAGCLAGPLVAAAYGYFLDADWLKQALPVRVIDSKMLNAKKREESEAFLLGIQEKEQHVVELSPERIDEVNIYQARMQALADAAKVVARRAYSRASKIYIFVDGPVVPEGLKKIVSEKVEVFAYSKGDQKLFAVAAASIVAKNYRDRLMTKLSSEYPDYRWESNVGYPTPEHKQALRLVGPSPWHRRSFRWA